MNTVLWCRAETDSNTLNVITQQQKFLYENIIYLFYIIKASTMSRLLRSGENVIIVSHNGSIVK